MTAHYRAVAISNRIYDFVLRLGLSLYAAARAYRITYGFMTKGSLR